MTISKYDLYHLSDEAFSRVHGISKEGFLAQVRENKVENSEQNPEATIEEPNVDTFIEDESHLPGYMRSHPSARFFDTAAEVKREIGDQEQK